MNTLTRTTAVPRALHLATEDLPDPNVLPVEGGYFIYSTNARGVHVPVVYSTDLAEFTLIGDAMPVLPRWVRPGFTWAPEVAKIAGRYVLYFTARMRGTRVQVIGVATAEQPEGPFVATGAPLISMQDLGGAIDPAVLSTRDGQHYLYWKNDGNAVKQATHLWGAELSVDGLALMSTPAPLLTASEPWEHGLVEAPQVIEEGGVFHLLYSCAAYFDESYAVGHANGLSPLGPFEKHRPAPILATHGQVAGPGHSHAFRTASGQWQLAYHAWESGRCGYPKGRRALHLSPLHLEGQQARVALPEPLAQASD